VISQEGHAAEPATVYLGHSQDCPRALARKAQLSFDLGILTLIIQRLTAAALEIFLVTFVCTLPFAVP